MKVVFFLNKLFRSFKDQLFSACHIDCCVMIVKLQFNVEFNTSM